MEEVHFTNLLIVAAVGFGAPLMLGLAPALRMPAVVLEIVAGIASGPPGSAGSRSTCRSTSSR